ncbi:unnamed protein product, partial [Coregonus sp. 'balchen']
MFVHAQSFEDLTADSEATTETETERDSVLVESGESAKEEALCLRAEEETQKEKQPEVEVEKEEVCPESRSKEEDVCSEAWRSHRKRVCTEQAHLHPLRHRGGPLSTMGVMMALVSIVEADNNIIRCIHTDGYKVVFLHKTPLVLVGVSRTCQSDRELTRELQNIYYQIVSQLTLTQLNHIFQHKQNYNLCCLLAGSEHLTDNRDPGLLLSTVTCLPLASSTCDLVSSSLTELPLPYQSVEEQERLMGLYQYLHSRLHHATRPLRSIYR